MSDPDKGGSSKRSDLEAADTQALPQEVTRSAAGGRRLMTPLGAGGRVLVSGDVVGHFVVLELLGEGGMGRVYSAYDPALDRKVAIKILRADDGGRDTSGGSQRLLREAQALARLRHQNVVVVHEVGELDGAVYVAMEQVSGGTARDWLRERDRSWREVVALYRQAGAGLAAAHAQGLIHRDFKPDNVLVGDDGEVRVTDFGLVSSITDKLPPGSATTVGSGPVPSPLSTPLTEHGDVVGTPGYIAPELFKGARADERSDQFAFCVTLYESLYGQRPFRGETPSEALAAMLLGIVAARPEDTDVPLWLDEVIRRGLAHDPADRYPSMDALLAELARDPEATRRRRLRVAAVLLAVAAITAAVAIALTAHAVRPAGPCDGAGDRIAQVWNPTTRKALVDAFAATHVPYADATAQRVAATLDRYTSDWAEMRVETCKANKVRGEQSDAVFDGRIACLDRRLADVRAQVGVMTGKVDAAVVEHASEATAELPELSLCADAHAAAERVPRPEDPMLRRQVDALDQTAADLRAQLKAGRPAAADAGVSQMLAQARAIDWPEGLARALMLKGEIDMRFDRYEAAEKDFAEALPLAARSRDDWTEAMLQLLLLDARGIGLARPKQALSMVPLVEASVVRAGDAPSLRLVLERAVGAMHDAAGDYDAALSHYQRAYDLAVKAYGPKSSQAGAALNDVAIMHDLQGRNEEARKLYQQVIDIETANFGPDHPRVARSLNNLAIVVGVTDPVAALPFFDRALAIYRAAYGDDHSTVAITQLNRGVVLDKLEKYDDAIEAYQRAAAIWRDAKGVGQRYRATALGNLGDVYEEQGDFAKALPYYRSARDVLLASVGKDHPDLAYPLLGIGGCQTELGHPREAVALLERARSLMAKQGLDAAQLAKVDIKLSKALWKSGSDRKRARTLGLSARDALTKAGETAGSDMRELSRWLATRGWK